MLMEINNESYCGYGLDEWCEKAACEIKRHIAREDADVHFLVGGTQTNFTVISAALRPYQSVISAESGHIHAHETGAVEHCGHKIQTLPHSNGKISAAQIERIAAEYSESPVKEHITEPKMVYISFTTEYGTIYSKKELQDIKRVCQNYGMYLFIDGARLGYGLTSPKSDVTIKDIAQLADVFYIGGTKCGALFGEAVVILANEIKTNFRSNIKQNGGMLAKGWLLGAQFYALFKDTGLYFDITKRANEYAMKIKDAFIAKNIPIFIDSPTNQQFVVLKNSLIEKLADKYTFEFEGKISENENCVRFCTSWSTNEEEVNELVNDILAL